MPPATLLSFCPQCGSLCGVRPGGRLMRHYRQIVGRYGENRGELCWGTTRTPKPSELIPADMDGSTIQIQADV
jgi:hypothetical protein